MQKGQLTVYLANMGSGDHYLYYKKVKPHAVGDTVPMDTVVYGGGDIVFDTKRSKQWMQYAVDTVHSGIVVYGGGDIVWCKEVKPVDSVDAVTQWTQYTVDAVCSGIVVYGGGDIVFNTKRSKQWT